MRNKSARQQCLDFSKKSSLKVVKKYREMYDKISAVLDKSQRLLNLAHKDFKKLLSKSKNGRESGYTSEQLLRAIIIMFVEGDAYRDTVIRIENSEFLRNFVRLGPKTTMDYTFLCKAFCCLSPQTWKEMNRALSHYAMEENKISSNKLRMDTTVYESNIHYPTDSSLLWDVYRVLSRIMKNIGSDMAAAGLTHRFHTKKVKKLMFYIARSAGQKGKGKKRQVSSKYRVLIERVQWITEVAQNVCEKLPVKDISTMTVITALESYIAVGRKVINQAKRRVLQGEKVPASEKVYSIFEEHTEMIKRGKAAKPVEFGHKTLFAETKEKFILHYDVQEQQKADKDLIDDALKTHNAIFKRDPELLAADKGFYESQEKLKELGQKILTVSIGKKGRRTDEEDAREHSKLFKLGQKFRAGCEGTISVLKRTFRLGRCLFKGFKHYASSVGCAVFVHNLVLLSRL